jgi:hypothetical protein
LSARPRIDSGESLEAIGLRCEWVIKYAIVAALGGTNSPYTFYAMNSLGARFELSRSEVDVEELVQGMPNTTGPWDFEVLDPSTSA